MAAATLTITSSASVPLNQFLNDVNIGKKQKAETLQIVTTILRNIATKDDPKYRQLRLENNKIKQNIGVFPSILLYFQKIGFAVVNAAGQEEHLLRVDNPDMSIMQASHQQAKAAYESIQRDLEASIAGESSASTVLSEKQKARRLLEEKKRLQKEEDRLARKRTQAQLKMDKHVRQNDPNWKPTVSAAAAKTGNAMQTFRDKFGE